MDEKLFVGEYEVTGNMCPRGEEYAINEMTHPARNISSLIKVNGKGGPVISCKTSSEIPKNKIFDVMEVINQASVSAPVNVGDVLIKNILDLGVDIVATNEIK